MLPTSKTAVKTAVHFIHLSPCKTYVSSLVETAIHYFNTSQVRSYSFADHYLVNEEIITAIDIFLSTLRFELRTYKTALYQLSYATFPQMPYVF
jgi:hypothetical protein